MISRNIKHGALAGLAGGVVFGMMMGMMGMLPMIAQMAGFTGAAAGFVVHLAISAAIGGAFGLIYRSAKPGVGATLGWGTAYGAAWWVFGPLTLMPLFMGMGLGVNWNLEAAVGMLPSLMGHVIYGGVLGTAYALLQVRGKAVRAAANAA